MNLRLQVHFLVYWITVGNTWMFGSANPFTVWFIHLPNTPTPRHPLGHSISCPTYHLEWAGDRPLKDRPFKLSGEMLPLCPKIWRKHLYIKLFSRTRIQSPVNIVRLTFLYLPGTVILVCQHIQSFQTYLFVLARVNTCDRELGSCPSKLGGEILFSYSWILPK